MIKLIVSDMDGTLLAHDSSISKGNIEAIRYAQSKGVQFAIATGRDYSSLKGILEAHDLKCFSILGNGAQFCNENGEILSSAYFPKKCFKQVLQIFDELKIHYMIFTANGFYSTAEPNVVRDAFIDRCVVQFKRKREDYLDDDCNQDMACMKLKKIGDLDDFINSSIDIIKVEAFNNDVSLIEKAKEKLQEIDGIAYLSSFDDNIEVTDKAAQKGLILENVIEELGYSKDEVMVLGDGLNDITLFERFKYSFAPGNANETIKAMAYQVVGACEEDGVSQAIYMML
ncbi:Cof-type HAD-IIB family hydrolase [Erysipelatoclostridium ramosum]|uniref:Cof-type HAD-IIB family hydrolase n=1 Tax=Thomasclavelia ramosa TaxID=1547 RepID=UPI00189CBA0A|nr:Cof-type HAD-IIB family hydrolase [Thomasclavelia ramosa]MDB7040686.1 Cof-type HAD-IIB family hydrolase [Thomasclavelia ramosa]